MTQTPRRLQGVTPIDGIAEEMGFDMDDIYQVLGRDILKSSLLDDIDLYLECDEDSLYVMPAVTSPPPSSEDLLAPHGSTSAAHVIRPVSSASASTAPDSLLDSGGRSESRVDSLGDTQLEDVAFPVSTFVNRANQVDDSERASTGDSPSSGSDNPFASSSTLSPHCDASSVCTDRSQACATARSLVKTCKQRSPAGKFPKSSSKAQVVTSNESTSDNGLHACERQTCGMHATETSGDQKEMAASSKQVQAQGAVFESDAGVTVSLSVSHSRAEGTAPKFQCPHCARSCTRATVLMDHRAKAHGEKNLFKCSQCCYEGHLFGHLQKHMKRRHGCSITSFQPVKLNGDRIAISPERICDQADQNDDDVECANVFSSQKSDFRPLGDKIKVGDVLLKQKLLHMFMSCDQKHHKKNRWTGKVKLVSLLKRQTGFVSALPEVSHSSCSITAKNVVSSASTKVAHKLVSRTQTVDSEKTSKPMEDTELEKCPKDPPITSTSTETHSDSEGETDSFTSSGTQRNFPCDQCSRTFRQKRSLVAHLNTHSGVLPFACSTCAKNFSCKNLLQQHEKSHWTQKPHRCSAEGCHRAFRTSTRLKEHVATVHCTNKQFSCEKCGRAFSLERHLRAHLNTHVGTFTCDVCAKTFRDGHNLKRHLAVHACKTSAKPSTPS